MTTSSGKGISHIFPFDFEGPTNPQKTYQGSLSHAEIAIKMGKATNGIKGPWRFTYLGLDFLTSNCIDYMHCVLLGVTKKLIALWLSKVLITIF
ncbi:hypothetical protein MHBO_003563 [Bonamia ostreae]|uniref:Uncharacterized protein n=1 Tax=Bonamia ostreae TaxID=126728 RepID=A0ABV2AQU8_9EUKA